MSNDIKLLPCPFCGGEAHKRIAFPCDPDGLEMNLHIVGCKTCDIEFSWLWDEEVAIELWNTRKPMDRIVEELEQAESVKCYGSRNSGNYMIPLADAIKIVKAGGVE